MEILKVNNKRKRDNNEKYSNKHIIPIIIIIRYHFVQDFFDLNNWSISLTFIADNKLLFEIHYFNIIDFLLLYSVNKYKSIYIWKYILDSKENWIMEYHRWVSFLFIDSFGIFILI